MTEEELENYVGKTVRLTSANTGKIYEAKAVNFESAYDNDPEEASLTLRLPYGVVDFGLSEIASIEIIK